MTYYLDTSLLVAAMTIEIGSAAAQSWLGDAPGPLTISAWTMTEVSSALAMKVLTGALTLDGRAAAMTVFEHMMARSMTILPFAVEAFHVAASFAGRPEAKLRAADALHLAIAAKHGVTVVTLDRRMAAAGPIVGVRVELVG